MITPELITKVIAALKERGKTFDSNTKLAQAMGINKAQLSRILNGDTDKVLSEGKWVTLARKLDVNVNGNVEWITAQTPVYVFVTEQLRKCQEDSISCMLCDLADVGKTYAAKEYAKSNRHAVYIDCSQAKSKQKLVRLIAKEFGVESVGRYSDVYEDLVYYVKTLMSPIVILDEAGDLNYDAWLELKALWNATERACGWFMIGADGLKEKVRRSIDYKKVGYTEIFSRYGSRYQRITPEGKEEAEKFTKLQAALIIKANAPEGTNVQSVMAQTDGSLRRIYTELTKRAKA